MFLLTDRWQILGLGKSKGRKSGYSSDKDRLVNYKLYLENFECLLPLKRRFVIIMSIYY